MTVFGGAPFRGRTGGEVGGELSAPSFVYRGSNARLGVELSTVFDRPFALAWQFSPVNAGIHEAAKSSPAVDASGIYVGADTGAFYAVDLDGTLRWSFHVDNARQGIHATATLDADNAYFGDYKGRFFALRKASGDLVWANQLGETIGSSAAIAGPAIYVAVERNHPSDGFVAKLDRRTGAVLWLSGWLGDQSHASPTIDEANGVLYVGANNGVLRSLALDTGQERWRAALVGAVKSTAVLVNGLLYVTTGVGYFYAVEAASGRILWRVALSGTAKGSPSYVPGEDALVVGSNVGTARHAARGQVQAIRARDGAVVWSVETDLGDMRASPTVVRTKDPDAGYVAWMSCGQRAICAFATRSGEVRDRLALPAAFTGTPTLYDGKMYITLFDGGLLAFQPR
jgi:outer membrane protein assembly factor BamB